MQIAAIIESYMAKQIVDIQSKKLHFDDKDQLPDFDNMTHEEIMEYANGISQQRLAQLQEEYEARKKAEQYQ